MLTDRLAEMGMWAMPAVILGLVIVAGAMWTMRRQRKCPSCDVGLVPVPHPDPGSISLSYEVLACPRCTNCATLVHGQRHRFAYCPACTNRSLRTPCTRLPDVARQARVQVEEHCELCGFRAERVFGENHVAEPRAAAGGKVIPFPGKRD